MNSYDKPWINNPPPMTPEEVLSKYWANLTLWELLVLLKEIMQIGKDNRIHAIKIFREKIGCGLKEAKDFIDGLLGGYQFSRWTTIPSLTEIETNYSGKLVIKRTQERELSIDELKDLCK